MARALAREGRRNRLLAAGAVVALVLVVVWVVTGSARAGIGVATMAGAILVFYRSRVRDDAAKWRQGASGERSTARMLRPLERRGFTVLHDRALDRPGDRANLDHVVIGPPGVIVVDSKNWHKNTKIYRRRGELWVGRTRGAKVVGGTAVCRRRVTTGMVEDLGIPVTVHAVLAVHGAKVPYWRRPEIEGIPLLRARSVRRWITQLPTEYDGDTVTALVAAMATRFPPYIRPAVPPD